MCLTGIYIKYKSTGCAASQVKKILKENQKHDYNSISTWFCKVNLDIHAIKYSQKFSVLINVLLFWHFLYTELK